MPTGLGVPHSQNADGSITTGTSAEDVRRTFGGLYTEGVVSGATVSGTTGLSYTISPGLVFLWYGGSKTSPELVPLPIPSGTVNTTAGPSSGSRTDYVWVKQAKPSSNPAVGSQITMGVTPTNPRSSSNSPSEYFILDRFTVPAGMTSTNNATKMTDRTFSVPYGTGGMLLELKDTWNNWLINRPGGIANLTGKITLPTDQLIQIDVGVTAEVDNGLDTDIIMASVLIDGVRRAWWHTGKIDEYAVTYNWTMTLQLSAGTHTIDFRRTERNNSGKIKLRHETNGLQGSYLNVKTVGIVA